MIRTIPQVAVHASLVAVICLSGCGHKPYVYGTGSSHANWTTSIADPTPGIDEASVTYVVLLAGPPGGAVGAGTAGGVAGEHRGYEA